MAQDGGTDSEIDRLARAINILHERLLAETAERGKLAAFKDDLKNMLVHDMKHPLTVLNDVLAMLGEAGVEVGLEKKIALLKMGKKSIRRQDVMIENLLQLARLNNTEMPLRKERISLASFMEECARENAVVVQQAQRRWALELDEELGARWIFGDRALLKRLVGNLVLNAVDHTPPETGITLGIRLRGKDRSRAEIFVRDEGAGVPPEKRDMIFSKYASFAESSKNVGLGLAFCRAVAEKHSARLELLESKPPGATVALVIPVSVEAQRSRQAL